VLETTTTPGLHDFVVEQVRRLCLPSKASVVDLGAGSGALAVRLSGLGYEVLAVDINSRAYCAPLPFVQSDLNQPDFAVQLGPASFDLVTAVEVLEHVESPIGFLRNVARLMRPQSFALLTTPNMDNLPARVKFLLTGTLRMMDDHSEPTHISPIFWDLLRRQFLPAAGLVLAEHLLYPPKGYLLTRPRYAWALRLLAGLLPGDSLLGDNHVLVLRHRI
jgi:2-polyprenyl-3-methyl-5-hydroxy-6-metoxy-1,4-benzoquinol methylase